MNQTLVLRSAAAVVVLAVIVAALDSWSPEAWAALAAWVTVGVAAAAGYIAFGQLGEARDLRIEQARLRREQARLRKEQAQPYVVAFMEFSEASTFLVDLVVRNFGATAAHDVHLDIDPVPRRSIDQKRRKNSNAEQPGADQPDTDQPDADQPDENVWLPDRIPVLVPGQEWRTLWDTGNRLETDLPDHHIASITYRDSQGEPYGVQAVLDWRTVKEREVVTVYGAHDAAKALREMSKAIARWKEGPTGGLAVYTRDGDAKDERERRWREARLAERRAREAAEQAPPPE